MEVPKRTSTNGNENRNIKNALYHQQQKDELIEKHKKYYQENKAVIRQRQLERNPDYDKQHYQEHRYIINQKMACQFCKSQISRKGMKEHSKTKKRRSFQR